MDQSEDTSWLILAGQGFGILLEIWKVTKTVNIRLQPSNGIFPYRIIFEDKHVLTKTEADTQEYDRIAFVSAIIISADIDVYVLGRDSLVAFLRCVLIGLSRAQKLVQLYCHHSRRFCLLLGFPYDGT